MVLASHNTSIHVEVFTFFHRGIPTLSSSDTIPKDGFRFNYGLDYVPLSEATTFSTN